MHWWSLYFEDGVEFGLWVSFTCLCLQDNIFHFIRCVFVLSCTCFNILDRVSQVESACFLLDHLDKVLEPCDGSQCGAVCFFECERNEFVIDMNKVGCVLGLSTFQKVTGVLNDLYETFHELLDDAFL